MPVSAGVISHSFSKVADVDDCCTSASCTVWDEGIPIYNLLPFLPSTLPFYLGFQLAPGVPWFFDPSTLVPKSDLISLNAGQKHVFMNILCWPLSCSYTVELVFNIG